MSKRHGLGKTRLHTIWHSMYCRCYYPTTNSYKNYGGKGIKICNEWLGVEGFLKFYEWALNNGYQDNLTIDRIDSNKNYEPSNCRWVTTRQQQRNIKTNRYYTYNGETKTQIEWCEQYNINPTTFMDRLKRNWTLEQALTVPTKGLHNKVNFKKGKKYAK